MILPRWSNQEEAFAFAMRHPSVMLDMGMALDYTVYRQDKFLDELSDKLYDAEHAIEPIDIEWVKEMQNDNR